MAGVLTAEDEDEARRRRREVDGDDGGRVEGVEWDARGGDCGGERHRSLARWRGCREGEDR